MFPLSRKLIKCVRVRNFSKISHITISEEVQFALENAKPVVALESTIITHGMPYPNNVNCALDVEAAVRRKGAIPATVAIIDGEIKVGLTQNEINHLGDVETSKPIKTSRRDMAYVVSNKLNGGTTVSGTLLVCDKANLPIFATGGIGGVHRNAEQTFDISADLTELGRTSVAVVSSGVKSILDISKTLEYLETQGVFVATYGAKSLDFPAFYSRSSGLQAPYSIETALSAARIIHTSRLLHMRSGMLFAVPVPEEFDLDGGFINGVVEEALEAAKRAEIGGKKITPFLLGVIGEITGGKSLRTNMALIRNNAETAADIAVELAKLREGNQALDGGGRPVVIGGSNLDCSIKLQDNEIKMDGSIHAGKFSLTAGGVGRNICEALSKLACTPVFISVLGGDFQGEILQRLTPPANQGRIKVVDGASTAQCTAVFDRGGECKFLLGDMDIHRHITPELILESIDVIKKAPLIVFDANLTVEAIEAILKIAEKHRIPALFEPTDVPVCTKPFRTNHWRAVKIITPNFNELKGIADHFEILLKEQYSSKIQEAADIAGKLAVSIDTVIVTLGADGVLIARKGAASDSLLYNKDKCISVRHYPVREITEFVNVSGAGDNLTSGLVVSMLDNLSEEKCVSVGFAAAEAALYSSSPVANILFDKKHKSWITKAPYNTLILAH